MTTDALACDPLLMKLCLFWAAARAEALRDPAIGREDLEQEARVALWQACRTHDPSLSSLKTWCWRHVRFAVNNFLQAQLRTRRAMQWSLDTPVGEEGQRTLGETIPSPEGTAEERLADADFARWLVRELNLTPLEALALRVHVLGGSYREVEEATGISWKSLDNAWQRVRKKTRKLLKKEGLT